MGVPSQLLILVGFVACASRSGLAARGPQADAPTTSRSCPGDPWREGLRSEHTRRIPYGDLYGGHSRLYCGVYALHLGATVSGVNAPPPQRLCAAMRCESGVCSMGDIVTAARAIGLKSARAVRVGPEALDFVSLPAIVYRHGPSSQEGHFILFAQRRAGFIQVIDYPRYVAWVPVDRLKRFDETWQGEVVLLQGVARATMTPFRAALLGASITWMAIGSWLLAREVVRKRRPKPLRATASLAAKDALQPDSSGVGR